MGLLFKKLFRDIQEAKGQFISILVVIVIGVMFYTSLNSALRNLEYASQKYFTAYRLADLWASFQKAPENVVERITSYPEVKQATGRVVQDVQITIHRQDAVLRLITLPDRRSINVNDIMLKTGRYFSSDESNQCLVDEAFYNAQGLHPGDRLQPIINGNLVKLKIIGVVKSPEFVFELRDGSELIPDPKRFGIIYLKKSFGQSVLGFDGSVNDVSILLNQAVDPEQFQQKIEKSLKRYGLIEVIRKKDQLSYDTFSGDLEQLKSLSGFFPFVFLIVAATIIYITMNRLIENQRIQIGTMKAIGYSNLQIMFHYLSYAATIGLAGSALGSLCGIYLGQLLMLLYNGMYQLPIEQMKPHYDLIIPAALFALFFCVFAGYNSCKNELRLVPAESMRPKAPKNTVKTWLEKSDFLWRRFNFSWKIIFRNLVRYKKRALLTSIGIVFATALLLSALGMNDSIGYTVSQQYSTIQRYDLKVDFNKMLGPADLSYIRSLAHVTYLEPVFGFGVEITNGWRSKKIGLTGLIPDSRLYQVTDTEGQPVKVPRNGILISEQLSHTLGAVSGDFVELKPLWPGKNDEKDRKRVRINGVAAQYIGQSAYGDLIFCGRILHEGPTVNQVLLKLDDVRNQSVVIAKLKKMPTVASIQSKSDTLANIQKALENAAFSIGTMILASALLAFAVVYNITTINIFERRRELATLKVLGFTNSEMRDLVFNENLIITAVAIGGGLFAGRYLFDLMIQDSATENMNFPAMLNSHSYLLTVLLVFLFTVTANLILLKKIHTINMVEALKSSE